MELRQAHLTDLPYVYEICHRTGAQGQDASAEVGDRALLGQIFAAPYLVYNPRWCWLATDRGLPVGYLLTTPDTRAFTEWTASHWYPGLRNLYPLPVPEGLSDLESHMRALVHEPYDLPEVAEEYPAHLHIDLLPQAQGHRLGTRLLELFVAQCRTEGVKGIHLGVTYRNPGAITFYQKLGFSTLAETDWGLYMGLRP